MDLDKFKQTATGKAKENKKFLSGLSKVGDDRLDKLFHETHDEVFAETDCLQCANCCKTTSPIFYQTDIERLSSHFRIRPGKFIEKYLRLDEDGDYVLA